MKAFFLLNFALSTFFAVKTPPQRGDELLR